NGQDANASMTNALERTRRETLLLGAAALVSSLAQNVEAGQDTERHGISAFGDLKYPPDFKHSHIKFHDGSPLTAHHVAFSLKILKDKGHPIAQQLLRDFVGAEVADDATVVVRFAAHRARDVPLFVAALPIFSRSYYAARRFDETTLEVPLGSGPY